MSKKKGLSSKQEMFCNEYLIDLNATQAAIRSKYSKKTARSMAQRLLTKVDIQSRLRELREEIAKKTDITPESVVREFGKIGFANIQDFIGEDNTVLDISQIDRNLAAAVESIQVTTTITSNKNGDKEYETKNVKLKLHSKTTALQELGKHLGIYKEDNDQRNGLREFMDWLHEKT